jgi:exosortase A
MRLNFKIPDVLTFAPKFFFIGILILIGILFRDSFGAMAHVWSNSENFSHGWLILPISLWLIWQLREELKAITWRFSWVGLAALLICLAMWFAGEIARVSVVKSIAVVLMIPALVLLCAGWLTLKKALFPLLFLLCMVPAGEGLTPMLMEHTATVTVWAIQMSGIPIFREGMHFTLPTGRWSVVEACSGLRYVIAAVILAFLFVYLNFQSWRRKVLFVLACLILSIVANWARAYLVVLVGHFTNMKYGAGDDHIIYGWVFFGLVMTLIFWVGSKFGDKPLQASPMVSATLPTNGLQLSTVSFTKSFPAVLAVILLISTSQAPVLLRSFERQLDLTKQLQQALGISETQTFLVPTEYSEAASVVRGSTKDSALIEISYFARQDKYKDMLASGQRLLPEISSQFVELEKSKPSGIGLDVGHPTSHLIRVGGERWMLLHWYVVGRSSVGSPYAAKAIRLLNLIKGDGDHSFSVVVAAKVLQDPGQVATELAAQAVRVNQAFKGLAIR